MASGKREGRGRTGANGSTSSWLGWDGDGWMINCYCMDMYCVGADQETAKGGARAPTCTLNLGDANEKPGRVVLDSRTVTPVQSLSHLLFRLRHLAQSGWRRPPRAVGVCIQERGTTALAVGLWSSDRGVAGTLHPCPAENTSHFPTSQANQLIQTDHRRSRSSHLSGSTPVAPIVRYAASGQWVGYLSRPARLCPTLLYLAG